MKNIFYHDITISLYGKEFKLVVKDSLLPKEQNKIDAKLKDKFETIKESKRLYQKLSRLNERFELEKALNENKNALDTHLKITELEKEMELMLPKLKQANEEIEATLKEKLMLLIDGDDKDILFDFADLEEIPYKEIADEIAIVLKEEKEKK